MPTVSVLATCALAARGGEVRTAVTDTPFAAQAASPSEASALATTIDRAAILAVDPKCLPQAPNDTWREFDFAKYDDRAGLDRIGRAKEAIVRGDFACALGELHALLKRSPDFPPALHMSGVLYYRLQRYGDSAFLLARYVEIAPSHIGETRMLGHDLYSLGRYDEARAHYERVLARAPNDFEALRGLALAVWRLGDGETALAKLSRATELAPNNDEAWSWKASIAFDLGDLKMAREAAERALSIDAFEPRTWFTLARVLEESGMKDAASNARARFASLSKTADAMRVAEAQLMRDPDDALRFAAWLDACVAHGSPSTTRGALRRLAASSPNLSQRPAALRAELDACRAVHDIERGTRAARDLEIQAGEDRRAWQALREWFDASGDPVGVARAVTHLER